MDEDELNIQFIVEFPELKRKLQHLAIDYEQKLRPKNRLKKKGKSGAAPLVRALLIQVLQHDLVAKLMEDFDADKWNSELMEPQEATPPYRGEPPPPEETEIKQRRARGRGTTNGNGAR